MKIYADTVPGRYLIIKDGATVGEHNCLNSVAIDSNEDGSFWRAIPYEVPIPALESYYKLVYEDD